MRHTVTAMFEVDGEANLLGLIRHLQQVDDTPGVPAPPVVDGVHMTSLSSHSYRGKGTSSSADLPLTRPS